MVRSHYRRGRERAEAEEVESSKKEAFIRRDFITLRKLSARKSPHPVKHLPVADQSE
jgi:hypothetical protein